MLGYGQLRLEAHDCEALMRNWPKNEEFDALMNAPGSQSGAALTHEDWLLPKSSCSSQD